MGTAFTPGLAIAESATVRKTRRLPVKGEVLVRAGDRVAPDTVVARVDLPGPLAAVRAAQSLGCPAEMLHMHCAVKEGDAVAVDQVLAERRVFFGLIFNRCRSPRAGTVEYISKLSGSIGIRGAPRPVTCTAYVSGAVVEVIPGEGVIVETVGAFVQGIFGVGGERHGHLRWMDNGRETLRGEDITAADRGRVLLHPGRIEASALTAAAAHGVAGLVGASIVDSELMGYLGFDIGVAITGEEHIPFSLIVTEGFGQMAMPDRTAGLLRSLDGQLAAINGTTQIRAGVVRPEIVVPREGVRGAETSAAQPLLIGTRVRLIRRPNFGRLGRVTGLPEKPVQIASGSLVRVLAVALGGGGEAVVPRANVEILGL